MSTRLISYTSRLADRGAEVGFREYKEPFKEPQNSRPFHGLTQVCQLIRKEFRPIYMRHHLRPHPSLLEGIYISWGAIPTKAQLFDEGFRLRSRDYQKILSTASG
ncbi:hypothetical protein IQ07DRAFT_30589 [Pyrenochaeta sp. DS3sAY3a]|nr:hypothetical protein IQ07DRAFT_30589 [Pyrenochaeta sp. DS3sAY3a]